MQPYTPQHQTSSIFPMAQTQHVDEAIDYAARACRAIVSEFVAAPAADNTRIDIALEFFVPPESIDQFTQELDRALVRKTLGYSTARRHQRLQPLNVVVLPPGAFHQWRMAWNLSPQRHHDRRWSPQRDLLEAILRQGNEGFREMDAIV